MSQMKKYGSKTKNADSDLSCCNSLCLRMVIILPR